MLDDAIKWKWSHASIGYTIYRDHHFTKDPTPTITTIFRNTPAHLALGITRMQSSINNLTCTFSESMYQLATGLRSMLDPSTIVKLHPLHSFRTVGLRRDLKTLGDLATLKTAEDCLWGHLLGASSIKNELTSGGHKTTPSVVDETRCSTLVRQIKSDAAWIFDESLSIPGGPTWKLARELENIRIICEQALPQKNRLAVILGTDIDLPGKERLQFPTEERRRELELAESSVFRAAVREMAVAEGRRSNLIEFDDQEPDDWISRRKREIALGSKFRHRLAILHAKMGQRPCEGFLKEVVLWWMHMIAFNGKFPQMACQDSPVLECSEFPLIYNISFDRALVEMLPDVMDYLVRGPAIVSQPESVSSS